LEWGLQSEKCTPSCIRLLYLDTWTAAANPASVACSERIKTEPERIVSSMTDWQPSPGWHTNPSTGSQRLPVVGFHVLAWPLQAIWAPQHRRRAVRVGRPTMLAILGNKILPRIGDCLLARTGYDSPQYDGPPDPGWQYNVWNPVPGDRGAEGIFGHRSRDSSSQLWLTTHHDWLLGAAAAALSLLGLRLIPLKAVETVSRRSARRTRPGSWLSLPRPRAPRAGATSKLDRDLPAQKKGDLD
jgi:hypothetical protein